MHIRWGPGALPGYSGPSLSCWAMYTLAQPQQPQGNHQAPLNNIPLGQEQTDSPGQLGTRKEHLCEGEHPEQGVSCSSPACCNLPVKTFLKQSFGGLGV